MIFLLLNNKLQHTYWFKQYPFFISQLYRSKAQVGSSVVSTQFQGRNQGVGQAGRLSGGSGKEINSQLIQIIGRIQFFSAALELRSFLTIKLGPLSAAGGHPHSLSHHPLLLQSSHCTLSPSALNLSGFPFCQLPEKGCQLLRAFLITLNSLV